MTGVLNHVVVVKIKATDRPSERGSSPMLWTIFVVILLLWVLGFSFHIAGGLIHILLIVALISLIYNLFAGRRNRL
jgi:hypothetical protein